VENLKLEMVRELRDMKQNLKDANLSNSELLRELKDMNMALMRQAQWKSATAASGGSPSV
jgi:hypothetical protein